MIHLYDQSETIIYCGNSKVFICLLVKKAGCVQTYENLTIATIDNSFTLFPHHVL